MGIINTIKKKVKSVVKKVVKKPTATPAQAAKTTTKAVVPNYSNMGTQQSVAPKKETQYSAAGKEAQAAPKQTGSAVTRGVTNIINTAKKIPEELDKGITAPFNTKEGQGQRLLNAAGTTVIAGYKAVSNILGHKTDVGIDVNAPVNTPIGKLYTGIVGAAANNPEVTAAIPQLATAVFEWTTKAAGTEAAKVGKQIQTTLSGEPAFVVNTKTKALTTSFVSKVVAEMKKPKYVAGAIGAILSTYALSEWSLIEAKEGMIYNLKNALATGDPNVIAEYRKKSDEIFDQSLLEAIARAMPVSNLVYGFTKKSEALVAQKKVGDAIAANKIIQMTTGATDSQMWDKINAEKAAQEKANVDYYNSERKKMVLWEQEAARAGNKEEAAFWAKEKEKQRKLELENQKAVVDFWLAYKKESQKLSENSAPSKLNFGLI
jgi:hypothetical protein